MYIYGQGILILTLHVSYVLGRATPAEVAALLGLSNTTAGPASAPVLLGRTVVNLSEILATGVEPGYEPRVLIDGRGERQGVVCVQLLARETLQRAARNEQALVSL